MSKRAIIILCSLISIILLCFLGYLILNGFNYRENNLNKTGGVNRTNTITNKKTTNIIETSSEEKVVAIPSTKLEMVQYYEECGHVVKDEYKIPSVVVNMNEEQVKKYYTGWELQDFSKEKIKLFKNNSGLCTEHFVIKDVDGYVSVFSLNQKGEETLYRATDILTRYLSDQDKASLKNGIKVVGKDDLEIALEDLE